MNSAVIKNALKEMKEFIQHTEKHLKKSTSLTCFNQSIHPSSPEQFFWKLYTSAQFFSKIERYEIEKLISRFTNLNKRLITELSDLNENELSEVKNMFYETIEKNYTFNHSQLHDFFKQNPTIHQKEQFKDILITLGKRTIDIYFDWENPSIHKELLLLSLRLFDLRFSGQEPLDLIEAKRHTLFSLDVLDKRANGNEVILHGLKETVFEWYRSTNQTFLNHPDSFYSRRYIHRYWYLMNDEQKEIHRKMAISHIIKKFNELKDQTNVTNDELQKMKSEKNELEYLLAKN